MKMEDANFEVCADPWTDQEHVCLQIAFGCQTVISDELEMVDPQLLGTHSLLDSCCSFHPVQHAYVNKSGKTASEEALLHRLRSVF